MSDSGATAGTLAGRHRRTAASAGEQDQVNAPDPGPGSTDQARRRISGETAIAVFAIPVIVVVGFLAYVWWRQTATLDSVEESSLGWSTVWTQILQHVELTVVSTIIVILIAVPLGILLTRPRYRKAAPLVVGIANAGQAAPSIGLIVLFFIWFGTAGWVAAIPGGSGFDVSVAALSLYAILPVLRNTIVGIQGVDPTLVEAGRGVGMSNFSVLRRIEVPLAIPVIMTGIRTALVLVVGTATLATFINGGGLGTTLTSGVTLYRYPVMVAGAVLVALLALLIEWLGRLLEIATRPKGI